MHSRFVLNSFFNNHAIGFHQKQIHIISDSNTSTEWSSRTWILSCNKTSCITFISFLLKNIRLKNEKDEVFSPFNSIITRLLCLFVGFARPIRIMLYSCMPNLTVNRADTDRKVQTRSICGSVAIAATCPSLFAYIMVSMPDIQYTGVSIPFPNENFVLMKGYISGNRNAKSKYIRFRYRNVSFLKSKR